MREPRKGWRHLARCAPLGGAHVVRTAAPLGATLVAGVAARGADPPGAGAVAALGLHPLASVVGGGMGGCHLHGRDAVRDVRRESALSALRPAKMRGSAVAPRTVAAKFGHAQGVAAVLWEVSGLSARGRDFAPARVAGGVRRAVPHLLNGPLSARVQARHRREGHAAPRLVIRGETHDGVPAAG